GQPLVRFIVDEELKRGKFDVVAEVVSAPIVSQLRNEELVRYGMNPLPQEVATPQPQPQAPSYANQPLPYVPEEEIDRSLNYGEYTFDSLAFGGDANTPAPMPAPTPTSAPLSANSGTVQPQNAGIRNTSAPLISNPLYSSESKPSIPLVNNPEQAPAMSADYQQSGQTFGGPLANVPSMPLSQQSGVIDVAKATSRPLNLPNPGEPPRDHVEFPGLGSIPLPDENMQAALEALPSAQTHQGNATIGTYAPSHSLPGQGYIYARLINAAANQTYNITTNRALVGRDTSNDIVVNDLNTSRHHAEIRYEAQNTWVITDLGSTNGTYVNGRPAMRHGLQEGDRITLGLTDFIFTLR
ncbi:MAG: FHA domain-containing protein, partial [Eggerthellaceae bacterium]|nr:FHA domain-containing protein [Eggerthellaceae bacterium]